MVNQEEIMQQLQAAVDLHNRGELDQAEAIYRQILAVDANNFYALNFCGCILRLKGRYEESCSFLRRSVSLKPGDIRAQYNLGNVFRDLGDFANAFIHYRAALGIDPLDANTLYQFAKICDALGDTGSAIVSYRKAIEVKPDFADAYLNLGNSFRKQEKRKEAIASYRKAIEVKPDFADAYFNLGIALCEDGRSEEAIPIYRRAIEIKPDFADAYFSLGSVMKEEGEAEVAADAFAAHYRLKPIAQSFSFASASASPSLNAPSEVMVPEGAEFIPSYVSDAIPFGMHLMYVHIPKAGGIRFSNPIFQCIQEMLLKRGWEKHPELVANAFGRERVSLMASHRIDSDPMRDGIVAAFSSYDLPALDFSFLVPHGVSSRELSLAMRDQFDVQPTRLATWRDPLQRLKSALDYLYRTSEGDLDLVREKIGQSDPFLDNSIYRGCFSNFSPQVSPDEQRDAQVDCLIEIADFSLMNQVMSSFLSRCRLPNIIVNKRVNVTSADKKMDPAIADSLMEQCVQAGFISFDCAPEIEQMVSKVLPAEFDLQVDLSSASLHPLTFVVSAATDVTISGSACFLPTEYLLTDEGQEFLQKTFAE